MILFPSPTPPEYEDNLIKLYELNLGVFLGVLFEIRTFLVACNHMILGYKMAFSSISADPPLMTNPSDV
jgi:hypothetical protein